MKRLLSLFFILVIAIKVVGQSEYVNKSMTMPQHPRLLMLKGEEKQLIKRINHDKYWKELNNSVIEESKRMLSKPVNKRIKIGLRILEVSRENLRRIFFLSYAYRVTKDDAYFLRAEKEMLAAADFSDWNPSHFLDVSEMTLAMAIGYDWLYDKLSPASREKIRTAIIEKGLKASINTPNLFYKTAEHNWNQVCNAGMTFGALAIYESDKDLANSLINEAINSIKKAMAQYGPDGAYPEGPGYWDYGTTFNIMFISCLEKIYKSDFNLSHFSGFINTGIYSQEMITPSYNQFNYSDNWYQAGFCPSVFWFYSKTKDVTLLYMQKKLMEQDMHKYYLNNRLLPIALIYGAGSGASLTNPGEPSKLIWAAQGPSPVAVMRSSWSDTQAKFLGFKMGSPHVNHAHMDVGSFIFESDGVRWAMDFGGEEYNDLEKKGVSIWGRDQDAQRWDVFRYCTKSHNTLCFNDKQQIVNGNAKVDDYGENAEAMYAMSDLSEIYKDQIPEVKRAVSLVDKKYAVIQDHLTTKRQFTKVRWNMLTQADNISFIDDKKALLEKDGKKLYMIVDAPFPVRLYKKDTTPTNTYDSLNKGNQFVGFEADLKVCATQDIAVYLIPTSIPQTLKCPYKFKYELNH